MEQASLIPANQENDAEMEKEMEYERRRINNLCYVCGSSMTIVTLTGGLERLDCNNVGSCKVFRFYPYKCA